VRCDTAGVRFVEQLRSFQGRRIAIPVGADDLVLDVGSGDKPHWRADVLLDRYIDAAHAGQRSGRRAARVSRPLFDADAAAMPFADRAFDYSVCSHVLEHVVDPGAVIDELVRVSKAGYIEVPEASSAKILDFPSHLWWVRREAGTLVFTAKAAPYHDAEIDAYIRRAGIERRLADLLDANFDQRIVSLRWVGSVKYRIEGDVPQSLVGYAAEAGGHQRVGQTIAARAMTAVMTLPLRRIRRRAPIPHDDVVDDAHRTGTGELLRRKVYRTSPSPELSA
jgi:SAM-dependent methyltransferase